MWIVNSTQRRVYTVFKNPTTKGITMKTKKLVKKLAVVPSESKGIGAAIGKLETAQCYRYRRTFPDETRTARVLGNEESPHVDERRGCSEPYPFNKMNSKASTKRKSKS
jgi:hypothetical protein